MNTISLKNTSFLLGITALTIFSTSLSAQAQTTVDRETRSTNTKVLTSASALMAQSGETVSPDSSTPGTDGTTPVPSQDGTTPTTPAPGTYPQETTPTTPAPGTYPQETTPTTPAPGTYPQETTPTAPEETTPTTPEETTPTTPEETTPTTPEETTPPSGDIQPGRATRSGSSYIGVGGNIGITGGDTSLGLGNFTVISKIGFTEAISARPSVVFGDNTTILVPVTYDFNLRSTGIDTEVAPSFAPYLGGGLVISTGDDSDVGPMLTAGVDVPLGNQFTANAGVNVGFVNDTSVGIAIGVGYNFQGF